MGDVSYLTNGDGIPATEGGELKEDVEDGEVVSSEIERLRL